MFFAPLSEEEPGAPGTVKPPAQHRGKGETANTKGKQNGRPWAADGGKGVGHAFPICAEDHQSRHGADDDGVQEDFHDTKQSLLGRVLDLCGGVGDGCGAHSRFVGEDASGNADTQSRKECGSRLECPFEDRPERTGDGLTSDNQDCRSQQQIDDGCEWDQHLGHFADALRSPQHHRSNQKSKNTADEEMIG